MSAEPFNPYLAPRVPAGPDPDPGAGYRPPGTRAFWTICLLGLGLVLGQVGSVALFNQAAMLRRAVDGHAITREEVQRNNATINAVEALQALTGLATALAFIMWAYRARHNLVPLGAVDLRYRPGWLAWGWFVPIFSLFRPVQALEEVWRKSGPNLDPLGLSRATAARAPVILIGWWTCMLLWFIAPSVRNFARAKAESAADLRNVTWLSLGVNLIGCAACILGIALVRDLTSRQGDHHHRRLSGVDPVDDPRA